MHLLKTAAAAPLLAACLGASVAWADTSTASPGRQVFAPDFFAAYAPTTALDMVNRLPGFSIDEGADVRGFSGAAGNVLIDGARPTAKDTSLETVLSRIPASSVERIELIDGAALGGADAQGQTRIVNIVRKQTSATSGSWNLRTEIFHNRFVAPTAQASLTRKIAAADVTLGLEAGYPEYQTLKGYEFIETSGGQLLEWGRNRDRRTETDLEGSFALSAPLGEGGRLRLNAKAFQGSWLRSWAYRGVESPTSARLVRGDSGLEQNAWHGFETGGDLERPLADGTLKFVALANSVSYEDASSSASLFASGRALGDRFVTKADEGEAILRTSWGRTLGAHTIEFGIEGALNWLDAQSAYLSSVNGGPLTPTPLDIAQSRVEELRGEAFLTDSMTLSDSLTLDLSFTAEQSRITQTGDASKERSFFYPKPRVAISWRPREGVVLRAHVERVVGQLDFDDFISSAQLNDGTANTGNPDLEPSRTWRYELGGEQRFGARGVVELNLVFEQIQDALGLVPTRGGEAVGNLDEAKRWGFDLDATAPLSGIGVSGGELAVSWRWRDSEVIDPFDRKTRPLSGEGGRQLQVDFRQDLSERKLAWGAYVWRGGLQRQYRSTQVFAWPEHTGFGAWMETTAFAGATVRVGYDDLFSHTFSRDRYFYTPNRASGSISAFQYRERTSQGRFVIEVKGALG